MFEFPFWVAVIIGISSGGGQVQVAPNPIPDLETEQPFSMDEEENPLMDQDPDPVRTSEPQIVSGKFTTALEVKPILTATKQSWVALRDFDGQDLLYFTQIEAWRCGLFEIRYAINDGAEQIRAVEPCYMDTAQPNAMKLENHLPFIRLVGGSVETVNITLYYDDGTSDSAAFKRNEILMP